MTDPSVPKRRQGLVVVITGHGKGKTTAALGMALRACGHGLRVSMIQFMKGRLHTGEWDSVKKLDGHIEIIHADAGFCGIMGDSRPLMEHRSSAQETLLLGREKMESGKVDILILDEINNALHFHLIDLEQVVDIIRSKPPLMHLVLTGRDAPPEIIELADTVSEIIEIKHAFRRGIPPQPGIDY